MLLGLLASCSACGENTPKDEPIPMHSRQPRFVRLMSFNVNFGIAGDPSTIDAIAGPKAEIVLLQETNEEWERALVARLGDTYKHHRFDPPGSWAAGGMGILSVYPIESVDVLTAPGAPFFAWRIVVTTSIGRFQIFNLHLRPPMSDGGSWVVGYFSTRADRLREIQYHLEALDPKLPALFVGDFNEDRDNGKAIALLEERGFVDAVSQVHGDKPTWQWPVGGMTLRMQLDHMMYDARFAPANVTIVDAGRSDHKPVWADFEHVEP